MTAQTDPISAADGAGAHYRPGEQPDGRRVPVKKGWQITQMWARHHEIARLIVLGNSNVDIAKELGVTKELVSMVRNSPVVKEKVAILSAVRDNQCTDLAKEIAALGPIAVQRLNEALTTGKVLDQQVSGTAILKEANNILDRHLGKPVQRVDSRTLNAHLSQEDILDIRARAQQMISMGPIAEEE